MHSKQTPRPAYSGISFNCEGKMAHHTERAVFYLFPFSIINRRQFEFNPAGGGIVLFLGQIELPRPDKVQARFTQLLLLPQSLK